MTTITNFSDYYKNLNPFSNEPLINIDFGVTTTKELTVLYKALNVKKKDVNSCMDTLQSVKSDYGTIFKKYRPILTTHIDQLEQTLTLIDSLGINYCDVKPQACGNEELTNKTNNIIKKVNPKNYFVFDKGDTYKRYKAA